MRRIPPTPSLPRYSGALVVVALVGIPACDRPAAPAPATTKQAAASPAKSYTVMGRVEQLPDPAVKGSAFQVRHEAIPDFVSREGKVIGMNAMTMPFPLAPGVRLDGIAPGDQVELTFEVRWDEIPAHRATAVRKVQAEAN